MSRQAAAIATPGTLDGAQARSGFFRWGQLLMGIICMAMIANLQYGWTLFVNPIDERHGWGRAAIQVAFTLFVLLETWAVPIEGWFVDRFGPKIGYAVSIVGWSLAACGHGLVNSILGFKAARASLGLSEAGNFPCAVKTAALWFPKRERALATAIFNAGANAGPIIAPLTIPLIASQWGWRASFVCAGALGFIWLAAWWLIYESPEKSHRLANAELQHIRSDSESDVKKTPWLQLLGYRQTWAFIFAKALTDPIWWFFLIWLPDYFNKSRGLNIQKSGGYLAAIYGICTILSVIGGWLTGHLQRCGWSVTRSRKTGMFIFALCVLPIISVTAVGNWAAVFLIGLAAAAHQAWSATIYTSVSDMFPKAAVASVVGIGGTAGSLTGIYFPRWTGRILDHFSAQRGYAILFGVCSCAYLVAFVLNHLLAPRFDAIGHAQDTGSQAVFK